MYTYVSHLFQIRTCIFTYTQMRERTDKCFVLSYKAVTLTNYFTEILHQYSPVIPSLYWVTSTTIYLKYVQMK